MKKNVLLFLFIGVFANAQINRFFYEYKYIPDFNNKADVKKEMMLLAINKIGSSYYSYNDFVTDSVATAYLQQQIKGTAGNMNVSIKESQINYKVIKSYPSFKTYLLTKVSTDRYKVKEDQVPNWNILPEKQKIGEYNTQKATTTYGGKDWIAWFSTDIPFQDGPYKFYGLPGLIVKLEDTTASHIMTLVGNKKIEAPIEEQQLEISGNIDLSGIKGKEIEVTKDQFKKVWKTYINDPSKNMREMIKGGRMKILDSDGKTALDQNQAFRKIEKMEKEKLSKNNNSIEPDLIK